jgi:hypothetical protein
MIQCIWRAFGPKPHRQETFKLPTTPDFVAKVCDVLGLVMTPPEQALVLCEEVRQFIEEIEALVPHDLDVHLVWDSYATRKTMLIRDRLAKRPHWHVHPAPDQRFLTEPSRALLCQAD